MNIQLHKVISHITGITGMKIIEAIIEGERDSEKLAEFRDVRMKNDQSTIAKALAGDYREEHLFTLKQEFELYNIYQEKIAECVIEILKPIIKRLKQSLVKANS